MILSALCDLYQRFGADPEYDVPPRGRSFQKITFVVILGRDGRLVDIQDVRRPSNGRFVPRRVLVLGTTKPSGAGLNPCFLWDSPGYLLGWDPEKPDRARRVFESFRDKHMDLESTISVLEFSAVCRFLESWDPARGAEFPILEEVVTGFGVFQMRGETHFVHEHPDIDAWWVQSHENPDPGPTGQCLVTGETASIARLHPRIKGVASSLPGGATIAGFNDPAYWSYGLEQSFNAPVSEEAAHCYTCALNALLDGPRRDKHRLVVGPTTMAFWTEHPTAIEDVFIAVTKQGSAVLKGDAAQDETVRAKLGAFLAALRKGREAYAELEEDEGSTRFCILGLAAPTPARIAVRFFHQGRLADLLENLRRHHQDIGIERRHGDDAKWPDPELPPLGLLLDQTCPRKNRKPARDMIPPLLPCSLLEAIVTGGRYPGGLYAAVIRRIIADRVINYARACVIKGYVVRNLRKEVSVNLDTSRTEPAYRLGRLFAALEKTQLDALPNIDATIRDRFYAAASATPSTVFPRLLRTYQHHLAKLEGGRKVNREKLVQEILAVVEIIPSHLNLADQGLFALGYYHQMNAFFTKKSAGTGNPD